MSPGAALRGEVWYCAFRTPPGPHYAVVLTVNTIAQALSSVTVAVITGTSGPPTTHVRVDLDAGLTKYGESFINCTDLHTVSKAQLRRRVGLLAPQELDRVESYIRLSLGI